MTTQVLSKEQLLADISHAEEKAKSLCGPCADDHARLAYWMRTLLAAYEQEPFGYVSEKCANAQGLLKTATWELFRKPTEIGPLKFKTPLYIHAAPSIDVREAVRMAHADWSQATFGNVGPIGPLKHLAKEAIETANAPDDLSEWADCQFLLWDAQRRAGITDEQIAAACVEKLEVNKQRVWPEPKDGEPRLHMKGHKS